jgi:glutaminase
MNNLIKEAIEKNRHLLSNGKLASYIPALNDPKKTNHIGVCVVDSNGSIYSEGDCRVKFTIQSISKVISFILAIQDNGVDKVFEHVGCESTDDPFDYFIDLDFKNINKPNNPMINAGALVVTSLIKGNKEERFNRLLELTRIMANNPNISYSNEVYLSEKSTGLRNKAMAYLMKSKDILKGDVEDILDTYFKQCSIEIDAVDLANIGMCISSGCKGINVDSMSNKEMIKLVKGILFSCGMYDYSARYSIDVGVPCKSGVGGGIMGILPDNMGIGIYSPPLDEHGNPIAGIGIMKYLSEQMNWNLFN